FLSGPAVLNVARRAPQVTAHFLPPQPGLCRSPLAEAEYDGPPRGVERIAHVGIRRAGILRGGVTPVVLQIIHSPGRIFERVLILMAQSTRPSRAGLRTRVRVDAELQSQRVHVIS